MLSYEEAKTFLESLGDVPEIQGLNLADQDLVITKAKELMNRSALDMPGDKMPEQIEQLNEVTETVQNLDKDFISSSKKTFNLKKYAQSFPPASNEDPFGANTSPEGFEMEQDYSGSEEESSQFQSHIELKETLDSYPDLETFQATHQDVANAISDNQNAVGALDRYYQEDNEEIKADLSEIIYKGLPPNMQNQQVDMTPEDGMVVPVKQKRLESMYSDYLDRISASIKKAANEAAFKKKKTAKSKPFNLKTAQHHTDQNVIMYGPGQTRIDPFYRQPVSDWHIMERNKGWGGDIDGVWDVDWEAVWRGNVMDKYSRPYRDTKTGEWVGGYIQKRFEVDKWIPETNNLQLMPGERRKPIIPEHGNTESRLQSMRNKNDEYLGREYNDTSEPFNWREAKSKKMEKKAQRKRKVDHLMEPDPEAEGKLFDAETDWGELTPEQREAIEREIEQDMGEWDERRSDLDNMSPVEFGDAMYDDFQDENSPSDPIVRDRMKARRMTDMLAPIASDINKLKKVAQLEEMSVDSDTANKASVVLQRLMNNDQTLEFVNAYRSNNWGEIHQMLGDLNTDDMATDDRVADVVFSILTQRTQQPQQTNVAVAQSKKKSITPFPR